MLITPKPRSSYINLRQSVLVKNFNTCKMRNYQECKNFLYQFKMFLRNHPHLLTNDLIREINSYVRIQFIEAKEIWKMTIEDDSELNPENYFRTPVPSSAGSPAASAGSSSPAASSPRSTGETEAASPIPSTSGSSGNNSNVNPPVNPVTPPEETPSSSQSEDINLNDWIKKLIRTLKFLINDQHIGELARGYSPIVWEAFVSRATWRILATFFRQTQEKNDCTRWFDFLRSNEDSDLSS